MKTSLFSLATAVLLASSVHAVFLPPANNWKSSLTVPTPASGSDFKITKASQAQVVVSTGNITFKLKLSGVIDNNMAGVPATQAGNTYQVDLRYSGVVKTVQFNFDLNGGKTAGNLKFPLALSALPAPGAVPGDSIEVVRVKCLEGGGGPGAGQNFCVAGVTAK